MLRHVLAEHFLISILHKYDYSTVAQIHLPFIYPISILHKYDYSNLQPVGAICVQVFQFYISTIIAEYFGNNAVLEKDFNST